MQPERRSTLVGEIRFRIPLPVAIPLGALVVIGIVAVGFSEILLNTSKDVAVAIALVTAINILGAAAVVAARPRMSGMAVVELFLVAFYPVLIGLVIATVGIGEGANPETRPAGAGVETEGVELVAEKVLFDTEQIELPAEGEATVHLDNQDSVQHNFAVYENDQDAEAQTAAVFDGAIIDGGDSIDYTFSPPDPGEYVFQCDLHPESMVGTLVVAEGGEGGEGGGEEGGGEGGEGS